MNDEVPRRSPGELVAEGERLAKLRPYCHKMGNDQTAVLLMSKLHAAGLEVDIEEMEQCIRRMQIAVDTGIYPDALLGEAAKLARQP